MEENEIENDSESELDYTQLDDQLINEIYSDVIEASSSVLLAKSYGYYDYDGVPDVEQPEYVPCGDYGTEDSYCGRYN